MPDPPDAQIFKEYLDAASPHETITAVRLTDAVEWTRENLMVREEAEALDPAPAFLVASGSLPPGVPSHFYARGAELGQKVDTSVILDSSGDALKNGLTNGVYLVKPNLRELAELAGEDLETEVGGIRFRSS